MSSSCEITQRAELECCLILETCGRKNSLFREKKIAHFLSLSTKYLKTRRINSTTRRETKEDFDKEKNMTLPRLVIT